MKIRIKFSKQGNMKFIGHLDIMRYFQKVMRRADVDIRYSEGFSPHQIMSFAAPLGVGLTGSGEYLDIEVLSTDSSAEMVRRMNLAMVEGMEVLSYKKLPDDAGNAMSLVAACDYTVRMRDGYTEAMGLTDVSFMSSLVSFIETGDLQITKKTKKGEKEMDLRPYIYEQSLTDDGRGVFLKLSSGSAANIKPELLLEAYCKSLGQEFPAFGFLINREEVYADAGSETAHCFVTLESFGEDIE
ncbi:MAG: TIGR03936 family radical SAM-associated protein [Lachnospiraceae bacterium]|nr:TIGR03936 family radical SAM-associated protein [Lachnospiraceae bacterium]